MSCGVAFCCQSATCKVTGLPLFLEGDVLCWVEPVGVFLYCHLGTQQVFWLRVRFPENLEGIQL